MKYIFGPVPSRRLGQSLGIDPLPFKTCNWNCVYCQLGRTIPLTNQRREYLPREEIINELIAVLDWEQDSQIDWITFVGSGEPTLHSGIGWMIRRIKKVTNIPLAVITNGSTLYLPEVRKALLPADAVMPSLDAGTPELYQRINRPHAQTTFQRLISGLESFRLEYQGKLWIEVMLIDGLNDSLEALQKIADVIAKINPDQIHLSQPTRPPAESWVNPSTEEGLIRAQAVLGSTAQTLHPAQGIFDLGRYKSLTDAAAGVLSRHPMREDELLQTLEKWAPEEVKQTLNQLEQGGQAKTIQRYGIRFWGSPEANFPESVQSEKTKPDSSFS
jgi:wyosine [tRNA(Phe)-imidazoG37] synthetase (radical SAM superfamily)